MISSASGGSSRNFVLLIESLSISVGFGVLSFSSIREDRVAEENNGLIAG